MPKQRKPYEGPLEGELAEDILNLTLRKKDGALTVRERLDAALEARRKADEALAEINTYLGDNTMAGLLARTLMTQLKRRGDPSIQVKPDGSVVLCVAYDTRERRAPPPPVQKRTSGSDLPLLDDLRAMAAEKGVGILDLGRQRRAIFERLKAVQEATDPPPPARLVDSITTVHEGDDDRPKTIRRRKIVAVDPATPASAVIVDEEGSVEDFLVKLDTEEEEAAKEGSR